LQDIPPLSGAARLAAAEESHLQGSHLLDNAPRQSYEERKPKNQQPRHQEAIKTRGLIHGGHHNPTKLLNATNKMEERPQILRTSPAEQLRHTIPTVGPSRTPPISIYD